MTVSFQPCAWCPDQCQPVFDRVVVSYLVAGGTKVLWELLPTFTDPNPLLFQLQVGTTTDPNADDWTNVGTPVENAYFAIDGEQRVYGKTNWAYYRVKLTSSLGNYVSAPTSCLGTLGKRDWLKARNIARFNKLRFRLGAGQDGYLLKRRISGTPCPICLDWQTKESRQPDCPSCYGTGFQCGYYYPMSCVWTDMSPKSRRIHIDGQTRGTIDDIVVQCRMIVDGFFVEDDIWVSRVTDDRYYIHKVDDIAEVRGNPVLATVEMRPIPYSSSIYGIVIPDQLAALEANA